MLERAWRRGLEELGVKVITRFPGAAQHLPTHTLSLAVIPPEHIWPELHYHIDDEELRHEAVIALERIYAEDGILLSGDRWKQGTVLVVCSID
jgi:predicted nuclease with RNAse H fold